MSKLTKFTLVLIAVLFVFAKPNAAWAEASVRVYAASWCGYCKKLRADLKQETGTENRIRVDGVEVPVTWIDATKNKAIRGYPTTRISSDDGKLNEEIVGYRPEEIRAAIARVRAGTSKPVETAAPAPSLKPIAGATGAASKTAGDASADSNGKIGKEKSANGKAANVKSVSAKTAASKSSPSKLSAEKSTAKSTAASAANELQYFDWFVVDESGDQYCFETDADGNPLDPNEAPVDPSICEQAYANAGANDGAN